MALTAADIDQIIQDANGDYASLKSWFKREEDLRAFLQKTQLNETTLSTLFKDSFGLVSLAVDAVSEEYANQADASAALRMVTNTRISEAAFRRWLREQPQAAQTYLQKLRDLVANNETTLKEGGYAVIDGRRYAVDPIMKPAVEVAISGSEGNDVAKIQHAQVVIKEVINQASNQLASPVVELQPSAPAIDPEPEIPPVAAAPIRPASVGYNPAPTRAEAPAVFVEPRVNPTPIPSVAARAPVPAPAVAAVEEEEARVYDADDEREDEISFISSPSLEADLEVCAHPLEDFAFDFYVSTIRLMLLMTMLDQAQNLMFKQLCVALIQETLDRMLSVYVAGVDVMNAANYRSGMFQPEAKQPSHFRQTCADEVERIDTAPGVSRFSMILSM